jgi:glycosyltransferase involved in cell wall biosynthesis
MRFLGLNRRPIAMYYYNRPMARIREAAGGEPAPNGVPHAERSFLCIARLVEKKNHRMLFQAYAVYAAEHRAPRRLVLCGSGPLEEELRALAQSLGIAELVEFRGWQDEIQVARQLLETLALLLPSSEEQFGIAVIEALALGVPPIVSDKVGARDLYLRSGVNGFIVEEDNPEGLAFLMGLLHEDEQLWRRMAASALDRSREADVSLFVESALALAQVRSR